MKAIISIVLAANLMGCAPMQRLIRSDHLSDDDRKKTTVIGMTEDQVKFIWGDPDKVEYYENTYIWTYDNNDEPILMGIKDGKLTGWMYDKDEAYRRKVASAASAAKWAAVFQGISTVNQSKPTNCTTNYVGSQAYTNCR